MARTEIVIIDRLVVRTRAAAGTTAGGTTLMPEEIAEDERKNVSVTEEVDEGIMARSSSWKYSDNNWKAEKWSQAEGRGSTLYLQGTTSRLDTAGLGRGTMALVANDMAANDHASMEYGRHGTSSYPLGIRA